MAASELILGLLVLVAVLLTSTLAYLLAVRRRRELETAGAGGGELLPPQAGHMYLLLPLARLPHVPIDAMAQRLMAAGRGGGLMLLWLGSLHLAVASTPEMARELWREHQQDFEWRPATASIRILSHEQLDSVFSPPGEHHKRVRHLLLSALLQPTRFLALAHVWEEETSCMLACVRANAAAAEAAPMGGVDVRSHLWPASYRIVARMAVGGPGPTLKDAARKGRTLVKALQLMGALHVGDLFPCLRWVDTILRLGPRCRSVLAQIDETISEMMKHAESSSFARALLSQSGDEDITRALMTDLLLAGSTTIPVAIEWTLCELLRWPRVLRRAREELDAVVGRHRKLVMVSDLPQLSYLEAVMKETFRLHPPAPLVGPRFTPSGCKVAGGRYRIPANTIAVVNAWGMGRDPRIWENPLEFSPERFLQKPGPMDDLVPFSYGSRVCIGKSYVLKIVPLIVANLIHTFNWEAIDATLTESYVGFLVQKAKPLIANLTTRPFLSP